MLIETSIYQWMILNPIISLVLIAYLLFTSIVNLLDDNENMYIRYGAAVLLPLFSILYYKWTMMLFYGIPFIF